MRSIFIVHVLLTWEGEAPAEPPRQSTSNGESRLRGSVALPGLPRIPNLPRIVGRPLIVVRVVDQAAVIILWPPTEQKLRLRIVEPGRVIGRRHIDRRNLSRLQQMLSNLPIVHRFI